MLSRSDTKIIVDHMVVSRRDARNAERLRLFFV